MFNPFLRKNHPFMDAEGDVGGGAVTPQGSEGTPSGEPTGSETGTEGATSTATDPASQKQVQTPEQNAAFAEMRRKAEAAERKAAEAEQIRQRDINIAKKYGKGYDIYSEADIAAKYGNQGINTLADFEAALREQEARNAGIDPDLINRLVSEHPDIKKARELTARQEAEMGQQALKSELTELNNEYPDLKLEKIDDLLKLPNADKIYALAQKGYTLLDAYESANKAELRRQQAEAARQATLNSVQSKGHLKGNGQGTDVDTTIIPDDVLEMYKKFNPGRTMDEYKAHYKASLK